MVCVDVRSVEQSGSGMTAAAVVREEGVIYSLPQANTKESGPRIARGEYSRLFRSWSSVVEQCLETTPSSSLVGRGMWNSEWTLPGQKPKNPFPTPGPLV